MKRPSGPAAVLQYADASQTERVTVSEAYLDSYIRRFEERFTQVQFATGIWLFAQFL